MTAKIRRKWSSYDSSEDIDLNDGQFMVKLVTKDQYRIVNEYNWEGLNLIQAPVATPTAAFKFENSFLALISVIYLFF